MPQRLRSDNGSEFVCAVLQTWQTATGITTLLVALGSPWENGFIESFNACFRDALLNGSVFTTVAEAKVSGAEWRREYNEFRPHGSLGYQTPKEFSKACDDTGRHPAVNAKKKDNNE